MQLDYGHVVVDSSTPETPSKFATVAMSDEQIVSEDGSVSVITMIVKHIASRQREMVIRRVREINVRGEFVNSQLLDVSLPILRSQIS